MHVVGVDGCPGGWVAVVWDMSADTWDASFHTTIDAIIDRYPDAACIGIDIPIGLRDDGRPRGCDVAARALLGWPRGSSVFPAPQRRLLAFHSYAETNERSRVDFGRGISRQAFGIFAKVREVDEVMTPDRQRLVVEVHPEISFWAMNAGRAMTRSKKTSEGFDERRTLLADAMRLDIPETRRLARQRTPFAGADDLLDAFAAAWTARRHATGDSLRLFANPDIDAHGLTMEIVV